MFSFICAWIKSWVNDREAGDLRRHRAHYVIIAMITQAMINKKKCAVFMNGLIVCFPYTVIGVFARFGGAVPRRYKYMSETFLSCLHLCCYWASSTWGFGTSLFFCKYNSEFDWLQKVTAARKFALVSPAVRSVNKSRRIYKLHPKRATISDLCRFRHSFILQSHRN